MEGWCPPCLPAQNSCVHKGVADPGVLARIAERANGIISRRISELWRIHSGTVSCPRFLLQEVPAKVRIESWSHIPLVGVSVLCLSGVGRFLGNKEYFPLASSRAQGEPTDGRAEHLTVVGDLLFRIVLSAYPGETWGYGLLLANVLYYRVLPTKCVDRLRFVSRSLFLFLTVRSKSASSAREITCPLHIAVLFCWA